MSDWQTLSLGEVATFASGNGFSDSFQGLRHGELPFYKVSDMSAEGNDTFLVDSRNYVSRVTALNQGWKIVPSSSVVFAKVGAALLLNRRRKLSSDCLIDNNMMAAIPSELVTTDWLYWQLKMVDFRNFVQDGAVPSVNQKQVSVIPIAVPPIEVQKAIVDILDTIDTQIRQTEAIIAKLQQVKQGLLHDLLTRGIDANGQLRTPREQAPELYNESPLGWIPREWELRTFGELARYTNGNSFSAERWKDSGLPIIRIQNLNGEQTFNYYQGPTKEEWFVSPGDLLFAWSGQRGVSFGSRIWNGPEGVLNQHIFKVWANEQLVSKEFLHVLLKFRQSVIEDSAHGFKDSFLHVTRGELTSVVAAVPGLEEQAGLCAIIEAHNKKINTNTDFLNKLKNQKSGLMDDLLTGRVCVTELTERQLAS